MIFYRNNIMRSHESFDDISYGIPQKFIINGTVSRLIFSIGDFEVNEDYSCEYVLACHLMANLQLIRERRLRIFTLEFDPLFDVEFQKDSVLLLRAGKVRIKVNFNKLIESFELCRILVSSDLEAIDKYFLVDLNKSVKKLVEDMEGIGYSARDSRG